MILKRFFLSVMLLAGITHAGAMNHAPENISVALKVPGNDAKRYSLTLQKQQDGIYSCHSPEKLPLLITRKVTEKYGKNASML